MMGLSGFFKHFFLRVYSRKICHVCLVTFAALTLTGCGKRNDLSDAMEALARAKHTGIITDEVLQFIPLGTEETTAVEMLLEAGLHEIPFRGFDEFDKIKRNSENYRLFKDDRGWLWPLQWDYYLVRVGISEGAVDYLDAVVKIKSL